MYLYITKEEYNAINYALDELFIVGDTVSVRRLQSVIAKYNKAIDKKRTSNDQLRYSHKAHKSC